MEIKKEIKIEWGRNRKEKQKKSNNKSYLWNYREISTHTLLTRCKTIEGV